MSTNVSAVLDPKEHVPWMKSRQERSGLDIIFSCLAIIVTCTWTTLHLSIPPKSYSKSRKILRKMKWMAVMVVLPEYIFSHAVLELKTALDDYVLLAEEKGSYYESDWCIKPGMAARTLQRILWRISVSLGGKSPILNIGERSYAEDQSPHVCNDICSTWSLTHSLFANMGGFVSSDSRVIFSGQLVQSEGDVNNLRFIMDKRITKSILEDKSKASLFIKFLWILQVLRLVLDTSIRASKGFPITQLEIITLSFSAISLLTWLVQLEKPQDVEQPIWIHEFPSATNHPTTGYEKLSPSSEIGSMCSLLFSQTRRKDIDHIPNDFIRDLPGHHRLLCVTLCSSAFFFGSIHVAAWNFAFPTTIEKDWWRACSLFGIIAPILYQVFIYLASPGYLDFLRKAESEWAKVAEHYESIEGLIRARRPSAPDKSNLEKAIITDEILAIVSECIAEYHENGNDDIRDRLIAFEQRVKAVESWHIGNKAHDRWALWMQVPGVALYIMSRFIMFGIAFASFRSAPRGIYLDTWASNIPGIG